MSRLQEAVDRFAAAWLAKHGEKPPQYLLSDGGFSSQTGLGFCLCFRPLAMLIDFSSLDCALCNKPVTSETNAWMDEASAERQAIRKEGKSK